MSKNLDLVISLSGSPGAGKSTVKTELAHLYKKSNFRVNQFSIGPIFRKIAKSMRISIAQLNELAKKDSSIDKKADDFLINLGQKIYKKKPLVSSLFLSILCLKKVIIVDSRMAWKFIPDSFKIRLVVDDLIAGERIYRRGNSQQLQGGEDSYETVEEAMNEAARRKRLEVERYKAKYGVILSDPNNYDLIIKTDNLNPKEIALIIKDCATKFTKSQPFQKFWGFENEQYKMTPENKAIKGFYSHRFHLKEKVSS